MFNNTKYTKIYNQITVRAVGRTKAKGHEYHHIIPESLGGKRDKQNMVWLTGREHFICHWLLTKMTNGADRSKMVYALNGMKRFNKHQERYATKITNRVYAKLKLEIAEIHSNTMKGRTPPNKGKPMSEEAKAKLRAVKAANPYKHSAEALAKISAAAKGKKQSEESRLKKSIALTGIIRGPMSEEEKAKRSVALKGRSKPDGFGEVVAERMRSEFTKHNPNKRDDLKKVCPHCYNTFGPSNFTRWHGDKCKQRSKND